jgi:hypothetical protein
MSIIRDWIDSHQGYQRIQSDDFFPAFPSLTVGSCLKQIIGMLGAGYRFTWRSLMIGQGIVMFSLAFAVGSPSESHRLLRNPPALWTTDVCGPKPASNQRSASFTAIFGVNEAAGACIH